MSVGPTSTFQVIPAIDLRGGRVVRLEQGDFARETTFATDPTEPATRFAEAGARWLHVVDLDGANDGERRQAAAIEQLVRATAGSAAVQVAGGLRDLAAIDGALEAGAARVVLGTVAITEPSLVAEAIARHGVERIAVAIDVRDGRAVGAGWVGGGPAAPLEAVLDRMRAARVETLIVTAIARDGLLGGPDLELLARAVAAGAGSVIASGGVATVVDLEAVRDIGCRGAIVGRAIYDGRLDLAEAIRAMGSATAG